MTFLREHTLDVLFACTAILLATTLAWDWTNVKSFISGGVVAVWLTLRLTLKNRAQATR